MTQMQANAYIAALMEHNIPMLDNQGTATLLASGSQTTPLLGTMTHANGTSPFQQLQASLPAAIETPKTDMQHAAVFDTKPPVLG